MTTNMLDALIRLRVPEALSQAMALTVTPVYGTGPRDTDTCRVQPRGSLDRGTGATFALFLEQLLLAGYRKFILDFSEVPFVDSLGLATLLRLSRRARDEGGNLCLARLNASVRRVTELTRIHQHLDVCDSVMEAQRELASVA